MSDGFIIFHLLGAVQGVFLATILLSKQRGSIANRILAVLMLSLSLDLATAVYHASGFDAAFPHLIGIDFSLSLLYGPLLYLYAKTLSRRTRTFKKSNLWHFSPFVLLVLFLVPFYLQSGAEKLTFLHAPPLDVWTQVLGMVNHAKLIHVLVYIGLTLVLLKRHRQKIRDTFSSTERINLIWLRNMMVGIVALAGLATIFYVLQQQETAPVIGLNPANVYDDYTLLGTALFVYAIGFMGLRQPEVFDGRWEDLAELKTAEPEATLHVPQPEDRPAEPMGDGAVAGEKPRYTKSGMDPETAMRYKQQLLHLMTTEKPYQRGDLTLQDLSEALSISPHNLTEVINTQLEQHFYDFVNGFRVQEVQERLADPQYGHLTLLAIGLDAGFNSKSSFNAVFKKQTNMTPSQFRAHVSKSA